MQIGPVSYPYLPAPQNLPSMTAACAYQILASTGQIAGQIASGANPTAAPSGANPTAAAAPSGTSSNPTAAANADLQAYADLAEIDLYLRENAGSTTFNNAFIAGILANLQAQSGTCDASVQALITAAQATFTTSGTSVTFLTTNGQTNFSTWWSSPAGLQNVLSTLSSVLGTVLQPSVNTPNSPNAPNNPAVFINLCFLYADAMLYPSTSTNLDTAFWGNNANTLQGMSFGQAFPYALAAYEYQMEFNEPGGNQSWSDLNMNLRNMYLLLPTPAEVGNTPNYTAMWNLFTKPPAGTTPIIPMSANSFSQWPADLSFYFTDPSDLSTFYGILLDPLYDAFMGASP